MEKGEKEKREREKWLKKKKDHTRLINSFIDRIDVSLFRSLEHKISREVENFRQLLLNHGLY